MIKRKIFIFKLGLLKLYSSKMMQLRYLLILLIFLTGISACNEKQNNQNDEIYAELKKGFEDPPISARPKNYWWWMNGYTDSTTMIKELEAMKAAGIGGLDLFEIGAKEWYNDDVIPAGPAFLSDESLKDIKVAVDKATELGLEVGFNTASSWNAGGSWIPPKYAAKSLYFSEISVNGPKTINQQLPFPEIVKQAGDWGENIEFGSDGKPVYFEEVAVVAHPLGKKILDTADIKVLNHFFNPETEELNWKVPDGQWVINRYLVSNSGEPLKVPSPNSVGPIIDHYDPEATVYHFNYIMDKLQPVLGDLDKTAIKYFYLASYEAKGLTWTSTLPAAFEEDHGYKLYQYIPIIFGDTVISGDFTNAFIYDYNQTISDLMINNHYRKGRDVCKQHGLNLASEAGGPGLPLHNVPVDALEALGALDQPRGEFWKRDVVHLDEEGIDIMWLVKEIAAASHIYQRKVVEEEAFTSLYQWQYGPKDIKELADRAFCEGMNRVVVHGASHSPDEFGYPGIAYFAGTHYNNKRAWYPMVRPFNDYMARISWVLQETDFQADVLYYYGDKAPNYVRPKNTTFTAGHGYDYEVINTEILLKDLYVEDGQLKLPYGVSFEVLALSEEETINPEVLNKLKSLASEGAVIIGDKPNGAPGLFKEDISAEIENLWQEYVPGESDFKSQKIWSGVSVKQVLEDLKVDPVFHYKDIDSDLLDFIHYAKGGVDFYLVRNTTNEKITQNCSFRVRNRKPEIWDPVTGTIIDVASYKEDENATQIPLGFEPYQAYFIVFSEGENNNSSENIQPDVNILVDGILVSSYEGEVINELNGEWEVHFDEKWGGPGNVTFNELVSWTEKETPGIKYYSGTANYRKIFEFNTNEISENERVFLELEEIEKMAEVWLNNEKAGIIWSKPNKIDITDFLENGENELLINVANTWSNRLTGDAITGKTYTNTNIPRGPEIGDGPWSEVPLIPSGLSGSVYLKKYQVY